MQKSCKNCQQNFEITDEDLKFYEKISPEFNGKKYLIPAPKLCPDCRLQKKLIFRNERTLYKRKCDLSAKEIISVYAPDSPYKVYDQKEWWSDKWDAIKYGKKFDFSKTLNEQIKSLYIDVPHASLNTTNVENSYFTNYALNQKNCYLIFGAGNNEDCMYGKFIVFSKDVVDCLTLYTSEFCYEGIASEKCYNCQFFLYCKNCNDCLMIQDCQSCNNCIACFGLRFKEYCYLNEYLGKEKYEEIKKEFSNLSISKIDFLRKQLNELKLKLPHISSHIFASENCTGDSIFNCKNCLYSFDAKESENCKYIYFAPKTIETMDCVFCAPDGNQFCYNLCSTVGLRSSISNFYTWYGNDIYYSIECHHCTNLFACIGLKQKNFCILNKQYTKEEYEKLVPKIIEHIQKTNEWGEYFDHSISPFAYNETIAQEYFPLSKNEIINKGYKWRDEITEIPNVKKIIEASLLPETISEIPDDILNWAIECEITKKPFKIIKQELDFYRKMNLPIPHLHPNERHKNRMALRNPGKLWTRNCMKCNSEILTTYSPDRSEIVYCEKCYLEFVY
jgi:hypothetical protein